MINWKWIAVLSAATFVLVWLAVGGLALAVAIEDISLGAFP